MTGSARGTVLVTGAGGFIGSHLVEALLASGRRVRALVRYASHGGCGWLAETAAAGDRLEIIRGDVTDARSVREAMSGCEQVFHLAALIGIPYSYTAPQSYVAVNVNGTLNVLEAARDAGVGRVVVTSTSEVYGTARYTPIDEAHPLQAQSPYSATKIGADALATSYHRAFGLPVTIVRPFNTFGPRQSARAVIPTIITQALFGDEIRVGALAPVRDMVFVADTAAGFMALADSDAAIGCVNNLATGTGVTVGDLVGRIQRIVGRNLPVVEEERRRRPEASEVYTLLGSAEAARAVAGWRPAVTLDEGLERTVAWFRTRAELEPIGEYRV
ncbi:MAG: SDR family NAD(P)-dependent oxidoreductase [Planctomycetia bacterium]